MAIYRGSRYATGQVSYFQPKINGDIYTNITKNPIIPSVGNYREHLIRDDDRLDMLAEKYYGDPKQWWRIAQMNPTLDELAPLQPGRTIRVPSA